MRKLIAVSILSSLLFIFACAKFEFAANWVDTYITRQLDHYFDTRSLQAQILKKTLKEDIENVRRLIYPEVSSELILIEKDVANSKNFNSEKIASYDLRLRKIFAKALVIFEPSAQKFVEQLNPSQVESFKAEFDRRTKYLEEESDPSFEAKSRRFNKIMDQLEDWIGELNSSQKKAVQNFCDTNLFPNYALVSNRNKLSREFFELFPDKVKSKQFVHQLFYNYDSMREPSYRNALKADQQNYFELIATILNKMTTEQKKHLSQTLKARAEEINKSVDKKPLM